MEAKGHEGRGWKWFLLATQVLLVLWALVLVGGLGRHSGSQVSVAAVNLLIWGALWAWASRHREPASNGKRA
jgi:hypothetical protein